VIPTYNEEEDIKGTLQNLVSLTYEKKEIIVVDESTDQTPNIVREFEQQSVRVVQQSSKTNKKGRCAARNVGILEAQGEIVVILNADVHLPQDFIERILSHYENGADYVLVEAETLNINSLFPRYVNALHHFNYDGQGWINWTEGFSCRREAAIAVDLFPDNFPVPIETGEDGVFGEALEKRYKKVIDRSIVVRPVHPATLRGFWRQRKERGKWPQVVFFLRGKSKTAIRKDIVKTALVQLVLIATLYSPLRYAYRLTAYSEKGRRDLPGFFIARVIELLGRTVGAYEGYKSIRHVNGETWMGSGGQSIARQSVG